MKRSFAFLLLFASFTSLLPLLGQTNFVTNGDFEIASSFPTTQGQLSKAVGWSNLNGGSLWPYATPDFFHAFGSGGYQWPNTFYGQVVPAAGDGLAGFITQNGVVADFREYLGFQLLSPMTIGQPYSVEFWLSNGTANWYGQRGSNNIGVAFTTSFPTQTAHEPLLSITPQYEISTVVYHTEWRKYSFTITPTQAFSHIVIGNFRSDVATSTGTFNAGTNPIAYYFIDNISVRLGLPLPLTSPALQQVPSQSAMELTWHVPLGTNGSTFTLERSADQVSFSVVQEWATIENEDVDVYVNDMDAQPGRTYYYRLTQVGRNGETAVSPLVEASFGQAQELSVGEIYPNPVSDHFSLQLTSPEEGTLSMQLIDASGRIVMEGNREVTLGMGDPTFLVTEDLAAGIYIAKFHFEGQDFSRRIVITDAL